MADITARLALNEDDWLFGPTARIARKEIQTLREKLKVAEAALTIACDYAKNIDGAEFVQGEEALKMIMEVK